MISRRNWFLHLFYRRRWEVINQHNCLLGLSSRLLWGSLVFLALSICGTAGTFGTDGRVAAVGTARTDTPGFDLGTEGDGSAFSTVSSFAPLVFSPQWGQNLRSFKTEAQSRWKRCEMLPYGLHSMKVPCGKEYLSCHFNWHLHRWAKTWNWKYASHPPLSTNLWETQIPL